MVRGYRTPEIKAGQLFWYSATMYRALKDFTLPSYDAPDDLPGAILSNIVDFRGDYLHDLEKAGLIEELPFRVLEFNIEEGPLFRE